MSCPGSRDLQPPHQVGDPVDVITGACSDRAMDLLLAGPLLLKWIRHYDSGINSKLRSLGWGHAHDFDRWLVYDLDGIRYVDPAGNEYEYPVIPIGTPARGPAGVLNRTRDRLFALRQPGQPAMHFEFGESATRAPLGWLERDGDVIRFRHTAAGHLVGITDSLGREIAVQHDSEGRVLQLDLLDPSGAVTRTLLSYRYDPAGNLVDGRDSYGNAFTFDYDAHNRMTRRTDQRGYSCLFEYDGSGRCTRSRGEDRLFDVQLTYHGSMTTVIQHDGGEWSYVFTDDSVLSNVIDPHGGVTTYTSDESGQVLSEVSPDGAVIEVPGKSRRSPFRSEISQSRCDLIPLTPSAEEQTDPVPADALSWEFGSLLEKRAIPRSDWQIQEASAQLADRENLAINPDGDVFDAFGRLVRRLGPQASHERWVYDVGGNIQRHTDRDGGRTEYEYASLNQRVRQIGPSGEAVSTAYTSGFQVEKVVDEVGNTTEFSYDLKGRLAHVHSSGGVEHGFRYDGSDHLIEKTDRKGEPLVSIENAPGGLPTARHLSSGGTHRFEFDDASQLVCATSDSGTTEFVYRKMERVSDRRDGLGVVHRRRETSYPRRMEIFGRFSIGYRLGESGALRITDPGGGLQKIETSIDGIRRIHSNGVVEDSSFDAEGRCLEKTITGRPEGRAFRQRFTYSPAGDLLVARDGLGRETRYRYDASHRLVAAESDDGVDGRWVWDAAGNLIEGPGVAEVQLAAGNRVLRFGDEQISYGDDGAIRERREAAGATRYEYDSLGMLIAAETPMGTCRFEYDPLGRRTRKSFGARWTEFYWDRDRMAAELDSDGTIRLYVYADHDSWIPSMWIEYKGLDSDPDAGKRFFLHYDHRGTPVLVLDEVGRTVWCARVAPYGLAEVEPGARLDVPLRFPGHYHDSETGLHYNRFRYYCPRLGRYLQPDPLGTGSGTNLYRYTTNPLREVDLRGLNAGCPVHANPTEGMFDACEACHRATRGQRVTNDALSPSSLGYRANHDLFVDWSHTALLRQFSNKRGSDPKKIHISFTAESAEAVMNAIGPKLRELSIADVGAGGDPPLHHKSPPNRDAVVRLENHPQQQGKMITIYTRDQAHADHVRRQLDPILHDLRNSGRAEPDGRPLERHSSPQHADPETVDLQVREVDPVTGREGPTQTVPGTMERPTSTPGPQDSDLRNSHFGPPERLHGVSEMMFIRDDDGS